MKLNFCLLLAVLALCRCTVPTEPICFAVVADVHLSSSNPATVADFKKVIRDLNTQDSLDFVVLAGDITEFGSDAEITLALQCLDSLQQPWYILAGNHDAKWSESGCNTFMQTFGYEQFAFTKNGILFIGTNSGPNMRMAPALLPRESMVWLDSLLQQTPKKQPIVFFNHYPLTDDMSNYFQVISLLKTRNIQCTICGHYHTNQVFEADGIPSVKCRSSLPQGYEGPGYNIVTLRPHPDGIQATFQEHIACAAKDGSAYTLPAWHHFSFTTDHPAYRTDTTYAGPDFSINDRYPNVTRLWEVQDNSDIGSAAVVANDFVFYANTRGVVKALRLSDGSVCWETPTQGKIYATPAILEDRLYIASTDGALYCLATADGSLVWKYATTKGIVASPTVFDGLVYIGGSDGTFRALDAQHGTLVWEYSSIHGFIEAKPYADAQQVVVGSWGNELYSFHPKTGDLQWIWDNKARGRMYSPAATWPVKTQGKIFFTTPERKGYAVDAQTGKTVWEVTGGRESIGLSVNNEYVYIKTMNDSLFAYETRPQKPVSVWRVQGGFNYEIGPSPITSAWAQQTPQGTEALLFVPTSQGFLYTYRQTDGGLVWAQRLSVGLINYALPLAENRVLVTTLDGKIYLLQYVLASTNNDTQGDTSSSLRSEG